MAAGARGVAAGERERERKRKRKRKTCHNDKSGLGQRVTRSGVYRWGEREEG